MRILKREEIIEGLNTVLWKERGILLAYLLGSSALKGQSSHDIDVAILLDEKDAWLRAGKIAELTVELAKRLNIKEKRINIVDLNKAPLSLKYAALSRGYALRAALLKRGLEGNFSGITRISL